RLLRLVDGMTNIVRGKNHNCKIYVCMAFEFFNYCSSLARLLVENHRRELQAGQVSSHCFLQAVVVTMDHENVPRALTDSGGRSLRRLWLLRILNALTKNVAKRP